MCICNRLGEGDYDAAEIDRDIISARLQRDVVRSLYMSVAELS